ncbi:hypothetical protein PF008_g8020 [Phytophthora fragariae]|uniref:HAT C-terminal dimerisation domain-containing protein n=1 Tax=Phytophthora fragariae TaxID=53985 RepID=A0A6G0S1E5_9STRA|nr:hypothetical protein PF008_g8020 [Phytophthora fragariae]
MMIEWRKCFLKLFDNRFSGLEHSDLMWIAYLDPRVGKRMSHLNPVDKQSACDALIAAASELASEYGPPRCEGNEGGGSTHQTPVQVAQEARSFMDDYMFGPDEIPEQQSDLESACADEFTLYLSEIKIVKQKDDPFLWWRVNGSK